MTDQTPTIGMYIRWTDQDGVLSGPNVLTEQATTREEGLVALKAMLPGGCRASIIGFQLGTVATPWFTEVSEFDALQLMQQSIDSTPDRPTRHSM